jgi:hypothetical protein
VLTPNLFRRLALSVSYALSPQQRLSRVRKLWTAVMFTKPIVTILMLVLLTGIVGFGLMAQSERTTSTVGKYSLLSGQFTFITKEGLTDQRTSVFRLDTATGITWMYNEFFDSGGKAHVGWSVVNDMK